MMWGHEEPLGHGHPDAHDDRAVAGLAATLHHRLRTGNARPLALEVLDYQPPARAEDMKRKLSEPWKTTPKTLVTEKCTQCGICRDACPAAAIVMDPYPAVLRGCFDCFSCVRLCPENAWEPETCLPDLWAFIRKRAAVMKERPFTRVFL
jgi:ferredoxin